MLTSIFVRKDENEWERGRGWPIFKRITADIFQSTASRWRWPGWPTRPPTRWLSSGHRPWTTVRGPRARRPSSATGTRRNGSSSSTGQPWAHWNLQLYTVSQLTIYSPYIEKRKIDVVGQGCKWAIWIGCNAAKDCRNGLGTSARSSRVKDTN